MSALTPVIEARALQETEDALREFLQAAQNIGLTKESLGMMLRTVADEISPPNTITVQ